jgi:hypothetical protein
LALPLTACLNPLSVISPENNFPANIAHPSQKTPVKEPSSGIPGGEPFTVDVWAGSPDDEAARAITGPDADQIKAAGPAGIRNFMQLIVVDDIKKEIVAFDEVRKESNDQEFATLVVQGLTYGQKYHFLMLMGHWERNYGQGTDYEYHEDRMPTLLAAGLTSLPVIRGQKVSIQIYPVVVDTKFIINGNMPVNAVLGKNLLDAGPWNIEWEVTRGSAGADGLATLLNAENALRSSAVAAAGLRSGAVVRGEGINSGNDTAQPVIRIGNNRFTLDVSTYTGTDQEDMPNSANLSLDYIPFNLDTGWSAYNGESKFDLSGTKTPVWVIRNGVNDLAQDENTLFAAGTTWGANYNGNGAVAFNVNSTAFYVSSWGDDDNAGTRASPFKMMSLTYQKVLADPSRNKIVILSDIDMTGFNTFNDLPDIVTITSGTGGPYALRRMGLAGNDLASNSAVTIYGNVRIVFRNIKLDGSADNKRALYVSGQTAHVWLEDDVVFTGSRDNPGGGSVNGAGVYIEAGTVTMNGGEITGRSVHNGNVCGGGVYVKFGNFTMNGGTIKDSSVTSVNGNAFGGGVYVGKEGLFTINSGSKIIASSAASAAGNVCGGGVYVAGEGIFILNGGTIKNSIAAGYRTVVNGTGGGCGGGVYVADDGSFRMNGGTVSGNSFRGYAGSGGGVYAAAGGVFRMSGGTISGNGKQIIEPSFTGGAGFGGGIAVAGEFSMVIHPGNGSSLGEGGGLVIEANSASVNGGGVYVAQNAKFMVDNHHITTIRENEAGSGGGVYVDTNSFFLMNSGRIYGNKAAQSGGGVFISSPDGFEMNCRKNLGIITGPDNTILYPTFGNSSLPPNLAAQGESLYVNTGSAYGMDIKNYPVL